MAGRCRVMTPTRSTAAASRLHGAPPVIRLIAALVCALGITAGPLLVAGLATGTHPTHHRVPAAVALSTGSINGQTTQLRTDPDLDPATAATVQGDRRGAAADSGNDRSVASTGIDSVRTRGPPASA